MSLEKNHRLEQQITNIEEIPLSETSPIVDEERTMFKESLGNGNLIMMEKVVFEGGEYPILIGKGYEADFDENQMKQYKEKYKAIVEEAFKAIVMKGEDKISAWLGELDKNNLLLKNELEEYKANRVAGGLSSSPLLEIIGDLVKKSDII